MTRGRIPKPEHLHVVGGTWRKDRHGGKRGDAVRGERLRARDRPAFVKERAAKLWAETLPVLPWLCVTDRYCFSMWCVLQAEFERDPAVTLAARISLLRLLANDLGLTAAGRARLGFTLTPPPSEPDPYFD